MRMSSSLPAILALLSITAIDAWAPIAQQHQSAVVHTSRAAPLAAGGVLGGVSEFDEWFAKVDKATCRSGIEHHAFGSLRGLKCSDKSSDGTVLNVPKEVVLVSSYADDDWDSQLAQQLWEECRKGKSSDFYGYCSLLARGEAIESDSVPYSTAPNTLRHWTQDQLDGLALSSQGKKLIKLHKAQQRQWKSKYDSLTNKLNISWEQFEWCMEVVHSRAFRGNYGLSPVRSIASALAPLLSTLVGGAYMQGNPDISDTILLGLAALAVSPFVLNNIFPDKGEAVLLPLIDSANHLEEADSSIQYDPLGGAFSLSVGPKCLVAEDDSETQLYISYGPKSDGELLLNYGFLPGMPSASDDEDSERNLLTQELLKRQM